MRFYTSYLFLDTLYVLPCIPPGISPTLWTSMPCPASILNNSFSLYTPPHPLLALNRFSYLLHPAETKCLISCFLTTVLSSFKQTVSFLSSSLFFTSSTWHHCPDKHTQSLSLYSVTKSHTILVWLYTLSSFVILRAVVTILRTVPYLFLVLYLLVLLSYNITYVLYHSIAAVFFQT